MLGQQPDILHVQKRLAAALGGHDKFEDEGSGKEQLRRLLAERAVLLLLDDVWERGHADAFNVIGPRGRILLTTRDAGLVTALAAKENHYRVELPTRAEARAILGASADIGLDDLPPEAAEIIEQCGRLPLALALCGGMVYGGNSWHGVLDALRDHDLEFLSSEHPDEEQHQNAWKAMDVSVRVLQEREQNRFAELAVFEPGTWTPQSLVVSLWQKSASLTRREAEALLAKFSRRSLVQKRIRGYGNAGREPCIALHDLLCHFATGMAIKRFGSMAVLHRRLVQVNDDEGSMNWRDPKCEYFQKKLMVHLAGAVSHTDLDWHGLQLLTHNAVMDMPPMQREIVLLARFHWFPLRQISEILNIPVAAVEKRLNAALPQFVKRCRAISKDPAQLAGTKAGVHAHNPAGAAASGVIQQKDKDNTDLM